MKRLLLAAMVVLVMATGLWAQSSTSSGLKSDDLAVVKGAGLLYGILIITDGSNDGAVVVYDNDSQASGTVLFKGKVAGAGNFGGGTWEVPVRFTNGVYVDMTGTGMSYVVYFRKE